MNGESDLNTLLRSMEAVLADGLYVFVTLPNHSIPQDIRALMVFREAEGTTLILEHDEAKRHDLAFEFPCRMITLNVHSALEAVGFIAKISTALADEGMGVNPVAGFFHDHLFVPDGREQDALRILNEVSASS